MSAKYEIFLGTDRQYYFTLHASNGQVIGKSETYSSAQARDGGITAVKGYGPSAPVVDLT